MDNPLLLVVLGLYIGAFLLHFVKDRTLSTAAFTLGALLNLFLVVQRGIEAGHFPFSNMYETMLCLGGCAYFLFLITEFGLKVRAPWMDPLIAAVVITPAAFVFDKEIRPLMPALQSPLFFPHVTTYILSYAAMAKACTLACYSLALRDREQKIAYEKATYQVICLGFPLLTTGLLLGAVWAKLAWGDYWSWDPKEMWSLITWLTYLGYFHFRYRKGPRNGLVPWLAILGFIMVAITLLVVNLSKIFSGLHSYAS